MTRTAAAARAPGHLPPTSGLLAGAVVVIAGTGVIIWNAARSPVAGAVAGLAMPAVSALVAGVTIITLAWRRRAGGGEGARALLGVSLVIWALGQSLATAGAAVDGVRRFGLGDVVTAAALPVAALALLRLPRRSRASWPALRLGLDTLLLASTGTVAAWWLMFQPLPGVSASADADALVATLSVFLDLVISSLIVLVAIRDHRPGMVLLSVGTIALVVGDIAALPRVVSAAPAPWQSGVSMTVAWVVIGFALARIRTTGLPAEPGSVVEDLGETRSTTFATVISFGVLAVVFAMPVPYRWVGLGGFLQAVVAVVAVSREIMVGRIRARLIRRLGEEALRDVLTGLPNRRALTARIRSLDLNRPWVLLVVDLDDFKEVNDLLGPEAGDALLSDIADLLSRECPPGGMLARMGGDEFGVLAPGDVPSGELLAERLSAAIRRMPSARSGGFPLSASIGVGRVLPDDVVGSTSSPAPATGAEGPSSEEAPAGPPPTSAGLEPWHDRLAALVESAAAVRAAKSAGRGGIAVYPGAVEQARQRRLVLESRLREALDSGRLWMYAQPLVDLGSGRVRGYESLARWTDDVLGPVSPAEFVPVAEQTGLVTALGEFALRFTLEQVRSTGLLARDVEVGVNVSPIQLRQPQFAARVSDLVAELDLPPRRLLLEVTEAILVDEDDPAAGSLAELAAAGIRLAIDDFGTGYSALGYLRRLPLDVLKIDRSWVIDSVSDRRTRHVVSGVIELAHQLGVTVVMEGVEDAEVADLCRELGADVGQGWFFGRPVPWSEAAAELDLTLRPN